MESTMKKYAERIARNEVDPHFLDDGRTSGLLLDPRREDVPLDLLGFGIYRLGKDPIVHETKGDEVVLVPQEGEFAVEVKGQRFAGGRPGGPFSPGPGKSNASAVYIPRESRMAIRGTGEVAFFSAPALGDKPPFHLPPDKIQVVSRGDWIWRRDIVSLISPKDASTNLIVGETYSPPGYWSGTPLHSHDREDPAAGESDHEEIYYHRFSWKKGGDDSFGPYGVQMLMDKQRLQKAYPITDRSVFAIPGGCHPVVASPVSALLYLWGLAGRSGELRMRDIPEFAHLKTFERIFQELAGDRSVRILSKEKFRDLRAAHVLTAEQAGLLAEMLREKGYEFD